MLWLWHVGAQVAHEDGGPGSLGTSRDILLESRYFLMCWAPLIRATRFALQRAYRRARLLHPADRHLRSVLAIPLDLTRPHRGTFLQLGCIYRASLGREPIIGLVFDFVDLDSFVEDQFLFSRKIVRDE